MRNRKLQLQKDSVMKQAMDGVTACEKQLSRMSIYYLESLSDEKAPLFGGLHPGDFWYSCLAMVVDDVARIKKKLENPTDNLDIVSCKCALSDRQQFLVDLEKLYSHFKKQFLAKKALLYSAVLFSLIMAYLATTLPLTSVGFYMVLDSLVLGAAYFVILDNLKDAAVAFNKGLLTLDQKHPIFKKYIHRAIYSKHYKLEGDFHHLSVTVLERIFVNALTPYGSKIQFSRNHTAMSNLKSWIFTYNPREVTDENFQSLNLQISADIDAAVQSREMVSSKKTPLLPAQELPSFFVMEQVLHKKKQKSKSLDSVVAESSSPVATSSDSADIIFPEGYVHDDSPACNVKPIASNNYSAPYYFVWNIPPNSLTPEVEKKFHEKAGQIAARGKDGQGVKFLSSRHIESMGSLGVSEAHSFQPGDARVKVLGNYSVGNIGVFGRTLVSTNKPNCRLVVFDTVINGTHGSKR